MRKDSLRTGWLGAYDDIVRTEQIIAVMVDEDLAHILVDLGMLNSLSFFDKFLLRISHDRALAPQRLRKMFERLGPTFVKMGQVLSVRPDIMRPEYIAELEKLQTHVAPIPFPLVREVIEEELVKKVNQVFKWIDEEPIASASIAQVHRGILKGGQEVAIKVQRPGVAMMFATDIDILKKIAGRAKRVRTLNRYKPLRLVEEFEHWISQELDFNQEADNIDLFYNLFSKHDFLRIPKTYRKYCTRQIIVMEYIDGVPLTDLHGIKSRSELHEIFAKAYAATMEQVFVHGVFHADPHPGNFLVDKKGNIALIDFGIVGRFSPERRKDVLRMLMDLLEQDVDDFVEALLDMGAFSQDEIDAQTLKTLIRDAINELSRGEISRIRTGEVFDKVIRRAVEHGVKVPKEFVLFAKSLLILEGLALAYDPHFDVIENARPLLEKLIKRDIEAGLTVNSIKKKLLETGDLAFELPKQASRVLKKISEGKVHLHIEDTDIKKLGESIADSSTRISNALIMAAFLIGGAMLMNITDFTLNPLSVLALIFFVLAAFMGFSFVRRGR